MTEDKNFKRIVRAEAKATGRKYSAVRADLRPPTATADVADGADVADVGGFDERFAAIVDAVSQSLYGKQDAITLVVTAAVLGAPVLLTDLPGTGRTMLAKGVASAIGAKPAFVDGRRSLDGADPSAWDGETLVLVDHLDAMEPADQAAVMRVARKPAMLLASRHLFEERAPHPLDDATRDQFLFDVRLGYADAEAELQVIAAVRDGAVPTSPTVAGVHDLLAMRRTAAAVDVPDDVRRFAVDAVAATRTDESLLIGASLAATTSLVQAAGVRAAADGRDQATADDVTAFLQPVLQHRVVPRR